MQSTGWEQGAPLICAFVKLKQLFCFKSKLTSIDFTYFCQKLISYGLLGPSGCGKTTMLKCIVGRIKPRAGSVLVFGLQPGDGLSGVPGRDVGYMPQEISIYEDFTIEETLHYFGKINRMRASDIKSRVEFLLQFLDLPSRKRTVVNLR